VFNVSNVPRGFVSAIIPLTGLVLIVHHASIGSAATSVTPEGFEDMSQVSDLESKTRSRRSEVQDYVPDENDKKFRQWLEDWRRQTSEDLYGAYFLGYFGYSNVMTTYTLDRICDAAHQNLITSTDDLYRETGWHLTDEYGQIIVDKIREIMGGSAPPPPKKPAIRKCSKCGQPGHDSKFVVSLL